MSVHILGIRHHGVGSAKNVREALHDLQPDMILVGQAANGGESVQRFRELKPDVTLMDLRLPDMSGIDALIAIRSESPEARVIILTTFEGDVEIQRVRASARDLHVLGAGTQPLQGCHDLEVNLGLIGAG